MGSRLFSHTTGLPAGRDFTKAADRADYAAHHRLSGRARIPTQNSLPYSQILEAVRSGAVKALWVVGTNPAHSWIDQADFNELRERLEFLVVQDMYVTSETAQMADLVLPAAGWGEKDGTFINSERRISVTRKVRRAPGQALADFAIFRLLAAAAGVSGALSRNGPHRKRSSGFCNDSRLEGPATSPGIEGYSALADAGWHSMAVC
jgi:predicted molibdopterin-dependent oxidoreductase YjgC